LAVPFLAGSTIACQRERHFHAPGLVKRQATPLASLTANEQTIIDSFSNNSISDWSYYYTHGDHVAGRNRSQAQWTADKWEEAGIPSTLAEYTVFLNYPLNNSLSMTYANGSVYTAGLVEDVLEEDETSTREDRLPSFHGYSATGNASAEFVYVGLGTQRDYQRLVDLGVELEGKVALAQYGGIFRGLKVKNAQDQGMIACIIYTDPAQDGNVTVENGYAEYPDGGARNPSQVQRGSVQFLSTYPGDPSTPGYPSRENSIRADMSNVLPRIPSIPISEKDALPLFAALEGHGIPGAEVNRTGYVGAIKGSSYSSGPAPGVTLNVQNMMEEVFTPIWNSIGVINGTNADETIIIGNHRDAWIIGGAADPNSGTAVMVELGRAFGKLLAQGWKPKRNIVLCSWDAEEYGLVGSTEWVEEYIPWLTGTAVSYLNIDIAASGPHPAIAATPELHTIATDVMKKISGPMTNRTMYDVWYEDTNGTVGVLGSGSDYTAFVHRGIGSIDMGSDGGPTDPLYPYHSNYDSYYWMSTFGDPGFHHHEAMGKYLSLLAYNLATAELLPFNLPNYADQMDLYFDELSEVISSSSGNLSVTELRDAIDTFRVQANEIVQLSEQAVSSNDTELISVVNHKFRDFQRGFTSQGGLADREFYQHTIFAPGIDTGYAPVTFPGITEAVEAGNFTLAEEWVKKTAAAIRVAGNIIKT